MISDLDRLKVTFSKMVRDGFDIKNYLKWGFYFFDCNKEKLQKLAKELQNDGYKYQSLLLMNDNSWRLYVTINDVLTPEKLHERNSLFNKLSESFGVSLYDGWDVEKIKSVS